MYSVSPCVRGKENGSKTHKEISKELGGNGFPFSLRVSTHHQIPVGIVDHDQNAGSDGIFLEEQTSITR